MSKKGVIWCSHPKHDEVLSNGKKKFWKTGPKPSHPKGKRVLNEDLLNFVNENDERIINGTSKVLVTGDYFCSTCFENEQRNLTVYKQTQIKEDCYDGYTSCGSNNPMDSPFDEDHIHIKQIHAKEKLNQVFQCLGLPTIEDM